jgi:hypothetical protein
MFPTRLVRAPLSLCSLAVLVSMVGGCGGSSGGRPTLPNEELSLLTLIPRDAFIAGRLDVGQLRATPHWAGLMEQLRTDEPALVEFAEGTRYVYFGIGGLVEMPPLPPAMDEQGNYVPPPAWAEWSERFGGHVPAAVVIIEGEGARICGLAVAEHQSQSMGGFDVTDMEGVAVLRRGQDFCAVSFTPMVATLLGQTEGTSSIADQLGSESPSTVARLALQVDSPTVAALLERIGEPAPVTEPEPLPEGLPEEEAETYRAEMARMRESQQRRAEFIRSTLRIIADGLTSVAWQVASDEAGFETRTHVAGLDASRLGMWRELSQMFFDILRAAVRTNTIATEDGSLAEFIRSVRIDETEDGYVIVRHTRHQTIARLLAETLPGPAQNALEAMAAPVLDPSSQARDIIYTALANGGPADIIAAVEPNLEVVRALENPQEQENILSALVTAYGLRGRYDEAAALAEQSTEWARTYANDAPDAAWRVEAANRSVCSYVRSACELHLAQGQAERALAATQTSRPGSDRTCAQELFPVSACAAAAMAALGRVDEGLAQLDSEVSSTDTLEYLTARVRVLVLGGRAAQGHALARDMCVGGPGNRRCDAVAVVLAESLAVSASTWAAAEPTFTAIAGRIQEFAGTADSNRLRFEVANCSVRARLDSGAEATRTVCAAALDLAVAYHGDNHAQVASVRLSYARALDRARMRTEATAQRTAAQPIVDALGPQHPLRARPSR